MFHRPPIRLLGAAALCVGLAAAAQPAIGSPAVDRLGPDKQAQPAVVTLGNGDRVQLTPIGHGRQVALPLPREDGTTPGLLLSTDEDGTTVQPTDSAAAPTVIAGTAPMTAEAMADPVPLHFESIGRDGRPANGFVSIYDVETGAISAFRRIPGDPAAECTAAIFDESSCMLLPPGTYSVMAFVNTNPAGDPSTAQQRTAQSVALVGDPELAVTEESSFTFDARLARPIEVRTPGQRSSVHPGGAMQVGYSRTAANGQTISRLMRPSSVLEETFYMQPSGPVTVGQMDTLTRLRLAAPDIEMFAPGLDVTPEYYDPVWFSDVSSDFPAYDGTDRLRVIDVGHASAADLAGRDLGGAIALAERSDDLSVAEQSNAAAEAGAALVAIYSDIPGDSDDPNGTGTKLQVPTVRLSQAEGLALQALPAGARIGVRGETASPFLYDLVIKEQGGIPADVSYVFRKDQLAPQVRRLHGQPTIGSTFSEAAFHYQPEDTFSISTNFPFRGGARERVEYRIPDADTRWTYAVATPETRYNALFPEEPVLRMHLVDPALTAYTTTARTLKPVGTAPITSQPSVFRPIQRSGDRMRVAIDGFVDADGNHGVAYSTDSGMSTLLQIRADDVLVAETDNLPSGIATVPPGESEVEVSFATDNPQSWNELSTHTETTWTFLSRTVADGQVVTEPVILADYDADVDLRNHLRTDGRRAEIDLDLRHVAGSLAAPITDVTVEASYDDGQTWRSADLAGTTDDGYRVRLPRGNGFLSLRLHASDAAGSVLDQTVVRALYVG
ncbi:MAG: PA domain-containing protein [Nocardioides sp.]